MVESVKDFDGASERIWASCFSVFCFEPGAGWVCVIPNYRSTGETRLMGAALRDQTRIEALQAAVTVCVWLPSEEPPRRQAD